MTQDDIPDLQSYLQGWSHDLNLLRQNRLLDEGEFIGFARDRGLIVSGIVTGDPGKFHHLGWLMSDGIDHAGQPIFHPFRLYPLQKILQASKSGPVEEILTSLSNGNHVAEAARARNRVVDLAILLEPIYWPQITGRFSWPVDFGQSNAEALDGHEALRNAYLPKVVDLVKTLDADLWQRVHTSLCKDAARMDRNDELYLLLRLSNWEQRKKLVGCISGALWLRHIAEVIRRAFEDAHSVQWLEEDEAFATWFAGGRIFSYGSERPLDDEAKSKPYLALSFGLFTGSLIRWYVEGETEYHAVLYRIPEPSKVGIELVNLRGNLANEKDNIALKLSDGLKKDRELRRFSMLSFDLDVPQNVKAIARQVQQGNIVGYIAAHNPDFEFANFTVHELAEIAALIDEEDNNNSVSGDVVRNADWTGIINARDFEAEYKKISLRKPQGLKGPDWGKALAAYAFENLYRQDDGSERPFVHEIRTALQGRIVRYDYHKENIGFDSDTFAQIDLKPEDKSRAIS